MEEIETEYQVRTLNSFGSTLRVEDFLCTKVLARMVSFAGSLVYIPP